MAEINIKKDTQFIKVLAAQAKKQRVESSQAAEAKQIIDELIQTPSPENRHKIAQTIAYTVEDLQNGSLDFLNQVADIKNIGYGDKAMFAVKVGGIKAYWQAKGSTTARSYVGGKQVSVETSEISARPAINIYDLRSGRINFADLIAEANEQITNKKMERIEAVLHDSIDNYSSPFYATGTGVVKASLDAQIAHFARLGRVSLLGDLAAVSQLAPITGIALNATPSANDAFRGFSDEMINAYAANGFLGNYNGCSVIAMANGYKDDGVTPILDPTWIYILPAGLSADQKNLKIVNEGGVYAMESQNIDDEVYEIRLDQNFGVGFVTAKNPTLGAYKIGA